VRFVSFLLVVVHMHNATAHLRGRDTQPHAVLQASGQSLEAQAEALLSEASGTALLAAHEKMANLLWRQTPDPNAPAAPINVNPAFTLLFIFVSSLFWILIVAVIAYFYRGQEVLVAADSAKTDSGFDDWKVSFCGCLETPGICFLSFCCPGIRWAETLSFVPGLLTFWPAFFIFMIFMNPQNPFWQLFGPLVLLLAAVIGTYYRQQLRNKFGMEAGGLSWVTDCLLFFCCSCCAIAQEARHVDEAMKSGHKAVMCPADRKQTTVSN